MGRSRLKIRRHWWTRFTKQCRLECRETGRGGGNRTDLEDVPAIHMDAVNQQGIGHQGVQKHGVSWKWGV